MPSVETLAKMNVVNDMGVRFVVPSVSLDVPLGELSSVDGEVSPPGFTSAYAVRDPGVPLEDAPAGTVFIVMHSLRAGGVAPGNFLIDVERETFQLVQGDIIRVGKWTYQVAATQAVPKPDLALDTSIWAPAPGRLIVITCLQNPSGTPSTHNAVIIANLVADNE